MNINTSNPVSFAGSFSSQKMPADKFTKAESDKILKFEENADEYMKNHTDNDAMVELQFAGDRLIKLVHKNPDGNDETIASSVLNMMPDIQSIELMCLFNNLRLHFEQPNLFCNIKPED